jgi:hypothetical protein
VYKYILYILFLLPCLKSYPQTHQNQFIPGEKLKYLIYYGLVNGGYVNIDLESTEYENKKAFHSTMIATTAGLADVLYKVKDEYQSYFDPVTCLPYKSIRDISEGRYKRYQLAFFDRENHKVINNSDKEFAVSSDILDMVSVFYYVRNLNFDKLKPGEVIKLVTFFDNEIFPFDMRYRGIETVRTKKGEFRCFALVPYVEKGRVFENDDDMVVYLSADRNRVPIRFEFTLRIGSAKCDLIEYSGLKY